MDFCRKPCSQDSWSEHSCSDPPSPPIGHAQTSRHLISSALLQCSLLHHSALVPLPGKQAGKHFSAPWHSQLQLCSALLLPWTLLRGSGVTGIPPGSTQLEMSFGHRAADIKQSIAANQCGSTETPPVRKKRNVKQSLFYKRETCRSYLHISGRACATLMLQYWGLRGCACSRGNTQ